MNDLSDNNQCIIYAYNKGYKVSVDGQQLISHTGKTLKLEIKRTYLCTKINVNGKKMHLKLHKLVAYSKFGDKIFEPNVEIRHLDRNSLNNQPANITLGTRTDNVRDVPSDIRQKACQVAGSANAVKMILKARGWSYNPKESKPYRVHFRNKARGRYRTKNEAIAAHAALLADWIAP